MVFDKQGRVLDSELGSDRSWSSVPEELPKRSTARTGPTLANGAVDAEVHEEERQSSPEDEMTGEEGEDE